VKGTLEEGADADLVVLEAREVAGRKKVNVEQVWKFGVRVCDGDDEE
jgi:N-acetylglucosamine-6-phosphate deacetylase